MRDITTAGFGANHALLIVPVLVVYTLAIQLLRWRLSSRLLCLLSFVSALAVYRASFGAFLLVNFCVYLPLGASAKTKSSWRNAVFLMSAICALFITLRAVHLDPIRLDWHGFEIPIYTSFMWLMLRSVTLVWEVGSGRCKLPDIFEFLTWTCCPLMLDGPVLRYSRMPAKIAPNPELWASWLWWRDLLINLLKFLGGLALTIFSGIYADRHPVLPRAFKAALVLFIGPWSFYLQTAGRFGMIQCFGLACGFEIPVSFNFPFFRRNIAEFWANWNMTATSVFRDYLFFNRWGRRSYNIYLNAMVVFLAMGLWHDSNLYWLFFGILHGVFFCVFLATRRWNIFPDGRAASLLPSALTYLCVCSAWYIPSKVVEFISR